MEAINMRNKGKRLEQHVPDYIVFDIETCGRSPEYRNHIIEISALKVRDGVVVDEFSSLVKPRIRIPSEVISLTGIDNEMVSDAPSVRDVLSNFTAFINNDILVGYNINTFDYNILYDLIYELFNQEMNNDFVDVLYAARRAIKDTEDTKLTTICSRFNIDNTGAHRALKDCYLTKGIYDLLYEQYGKGAFSGKICDVEQYEAKGYQYSQETIQLKELQSIIEGIISDGEVTSDEVLDLNNWIKSNIHLSGNYPFDRIYGLLEIVMEDGVIDRNEFLMLMDKFTDYINPAKTTCENVNEINICNKHFVLTGEFEYGSRSSVEEHLISMGGILDNNVKQCTDYVIVGSLGSQAWKNGNYGGKIKKAIELRDKGFSIDIIEEKDFFGDKKD